MRILFFGDSITDAKRTRDNDEELCSLGAGYVREIAGKLLYDEPNKYQIINRGISGDRIVDLYARIKSDVWNLQPDVLSILIGVNDVWHEIRRKNGVDIERFDRIYRMLIDDTLKRLPHIRIIIMEPFILQGSATQAYWTEFSAVSDYAKAVRKIAENYGFPFVALQNCLNEFSERFGAENYLKDGVHPYFAGATLIAEEWLKVFKKKV